MAKSKGSGVKILFVLGICALAGFAYHRYQEKGALLDDAALSGRFEGAVDDVLARHGVTDLQISKVLRTERRQKFPIPRSWIETSRDITIPSQDATEKIFAEIKKSAVDLKLNTFTRDITPQRGLLEFGKDGRIFQRLRFTAQKPKSGLRAALVIDDVGGRPHDPEKLEEFLALGIPVTYALLPRERATRPTAEKIHKGGHEIILHQPMEPHNLEGNNPGKAALLVSMKPAEIQARLAENLADVPYVSGVSNHMGSEFTARSKSMAAMLDGLRKQRSKYPNLYFLDSHTARKLVSPALAEKKDIPHLANDIFLDNEDSLPAMTAQLEKFRKIVLKRKSGIAIGHIQRKHMAEAIRRSIPRFKQDGIEFVYVSNLARP